MIANRREPQFVSVDDTAVRPLGHERFAPIGDEVVPTMVVPKEECDEAAVRLAALGAPVCRPGRPWRELTVEPQPQLHVSRDPYRQDYAGKVVFAYGEHTVSLLSVASKIVDTAEGCVIPRDRRAEREWLGELIEVPECNHIAGCEFPFHDPRALAAFE